METAQNSVLPVAAEPDVLEEQCEPLPLDPHIKQGPGEVSNNECTILDYLNEDCWRKVLDYLSLREIMQTERVSRRWQEVMLQYLSHGRLGIEHPLFRANDPHCISIPVLLDTAEKVSSFTSWTAKLGAAVVSLIWHNEEEGMEIVRENCPNLEAITLFVTPKLKPLSSENEYFQCLQRVRVYYCDISDACLSQFLAGNAFEELKILCSESITGECLHSIQSTKLKSLVLKRCDGLRALPLLSAADRLRTLTKLVLKRVTVEIGQNVHMLLDKLPRLEYLYIRIIAPDFIDHNVHINSDVFFEAVCRLSCLEYLNVDYDALDEHLEAVTRCCEKLRRLLLTSCQEVTKRGLDAVCRLAGPRLTALGVCGSIRLTDDDVVACVWACPNLTSLVLDSCTGLSVYHSRLDSDLLDRVAAARCALAAPSRLNLHLNVFSIEWRHLDEDVLNIDISDPSYDSDWVHERH